MQKSLQVIIAQHDENSEKIVIHINTIQIKKWNIISMLEAVLCNFHVLLPFFSQR